MKKTTILLLAFTVVIISGCENKQQIVSSSFDTFVLPKPRANLQKVIVNNKPLVSDEVYSKTKPQIALMPPLIEPKDKLPIVKLIVVDLDSQTLFAYDNENQQNVLKSFFISGSRPIENTRYIMDLPLDHYKDLSEFPSEVREQISKLKARGEIKGLKDLPHNHLGSFTIFLKDIDHYSNTFNCPMHYALNYFQGHFIHMTEPRYYSQIGQPASHGCIREKEEDAIWLYSHSRIGTKVIIERSSSKNVELVSKF